MAIDINSFKDFSGWPQQGVKSGSDPTKVTLFTSTSDAIIQNHLDTSVSVLKDLLGFTDSEVLPKDSRIDQAVFTLCLFYLENRSSQDEVFKFGNPDGGLAFERKTYFRRESMILKRVLNLTNKWRKVSSFMPSVPGGS